MSYIAKFFSSHINAQGIRKEIPISDMRSIGEGKRHALPKGFFKETETDRAHDGEEEEIGKIQMDFSVTCEKKGRQGNRRKFEELLKDRHKRFSSHGVVKI